MAYILHIDTSGETSLVALAKEGKLLGTIENTDNRNHAAALNNNIETLVQHHNIALRDIASFCVCGGPGSYTGLRIGLSTAKGFCYALDKPLMMHNRLLLLASTDAELADDTDCLVSILHAREKEYFIAAYTNKLATICEPQHLMEEHLADFAGQLSGRFLCSGYRNQATEKAFTCSNPVVSETPKIDIYSWAKYAYQQYLQNNFVTLVSSEPFYLKQVYTHKTKTTS